MNAPALAINYIDQKTHHRFHLPVHHFKVPKNAREYAELENILNLLIDEVREDENHPLADIMEIIGDNLERYDDQHFPAIGANISDVEMVKHLMKSHDLYQKDLAPIFGGQGNVSRFLNGERDLNKSQIAQLKKQFHISADAFVK